MSYSVLSEAEVEHFITHGYVVVKNCFVREFAQKYVEFAYQRLGYDPTNPATWEKAMVHMPAFHHFKIKEVSPRAWGATCDLLGGEECIKDREQTWGDGFIVNLRNGADRPWEPPTAETEGWHVDGDHFMHFLDSGEQGLLQVVIWQDIAHQGGGTFIAPDSIKPVAALLHAHPEGLDPYSELWAAIAPQCREFVEATGEAGDVVMLHPLMLHASSQNVSGIPRFMTNPCVPLKDPLNLHRDNLADFSPVEQGILRALNVETLDFTPTVERQNVVPERVRIQQQMLEEERKRVEGLR